MGAPIIKGTKEFIKRATQGLFRIIKERADVVYLNSVPKNSYLSNMLHNEGGILTFI